MNPRNVTSTSMLCLVVSLTPIAVAPGSHAASAVAAKKKVAVTFADGVLRVTGTNASQAITVSRTAKRVKVVVNGKNVTPRRPGPAPANLSKVVVVGKGGNDVVKLAETGGALPLVTFDGGPGNDSFIGGNAPRTFVGGVGNDVLVGGSDVNRFDGGDGNDSFTGGTGVNLGSGGPGNDVMTTGNGLSSYAGGPGSDTLTGGTKPASLSGDADADTITGGSATETIDAGAGDDDLVQSPGGDVLKGGLGDDTYLLDGDVAGGAIDIVENSGEGTDIVDLSASVTTGVTFDLGTTSGQGVAPGTGVTLSADDAIENVTGGSLGDTLTGNSLVNTFVGGAGADRLQHRGEGGGIDLVTDMVAAQDDRVRFVTGGSLSASALTIDSTATQVRDLATSTFGFDFSTPVVNGSTFYIFGNTDQPTAGQLITFNGAGGFIQGTNTDFSLATLNSNGSLIAGAAGKDRIVDYSPNGNTLVGRDGSDVLIAGDGDDTLDGDDGFNAGGVDTLSGGPGGDTFLFGNGFSVPLLNFGNDTVTDIATADTVDLATGLSVRMGLGTTVVTIWDGATNFGTITAGNGRNWIAGDFT